MHLAPGPVLILYLGGENVYTGRVGFVVNRPGCC